MRLRSCLLLLRSLERNIAGLVGTVEDVDSRGSHARSRERSMGKRSSAWGWRVDEAALSGRVEKRGVRDRLSAQGVLRL